MKKYKIGVFGAGRGCDLAGSFAALGCEITAICDRSEEHTSELQSR